MTARPVTEQTVGSAPLPAPTEDSLADEELAAGFVVGDETCLAAVHPPACARAACTTASPTASTTTRGDPTQKRCELQPVTALHRVAPAPAGLPGNTRSVR
jgi:hypothetical protein